MQNTSDVNMSFFDNYTENGKAAGVDNFDTTVARIITVIFTFTAIIGFFGNTLVILVIMFNKSMKTSTNYLVLNLALADLVFIIICVPFTAVKYTTSVWIFGDAWCRIYNYTAYVCAWASVYTLVFMSLDRCLAIVCAVRLRGYNKTRSIIVAIILMWLVVCLSNIPALYFHGEYEYYYGNDAIRKTCLFKERDGPAKRTFHFTYFIFGFMLPVVVIVALYSVLIAFLMSRPTSAGSTASAKKTTKRVTVMVIVVIVVFIACWLPIHIILVLFELKKYPNSKWSIILQICCNCLAYTNSCMNPILYTISSTTFRQAFKEFLSCKTCRDDKPKHFRPSNSKRALKPPDTVSTNVSSRSGSNQEFSPCNGDKAPALELLTYNSDKVSNLELPACNGDRVSTSGLPTCHSEEESSLLNLNSK